MARSRRPRTVRMSGASSSRWASAAVSQLPARVPFDETPLVAETAAAADGSRRPASAPEAGCQTGSGGRRRGGP